MSYKSRLNTRQRWLLSEAFRLLNEAEEDDKKKEEAKKEKERGNVDYYKSRSISGYSEDDLKAADEQLKNFDIGDGLANTVEWLNKYLDKDQNPEGENVARALHTILANGDKDGEDDQHFKRSGKQPFECSDLVPTQGEIDLFKSIGHPLVHGGSFMNCFTGDPHGEGKFIVTAGEKLVLDGHHRWSTVCCIAGPGNNIDAVDFNIEGFGDDAEKVLSAAQVAIVGSVDYDVLGSGSKMVPYATTSETEINGEKIETNILGAPELIKATVMKLINANQSDISVNDKYAEKYPNKKLLSDPYLQVALYGEKLTAEQVESVKSENPDADLGDMDEPGGFSEKFISHFELSPKSVDDAPNGFYSYSAEEKKAVREKILDKIVSNWKGCKSSAEDKPDRNVMPQFDGGESHKKKIDDTQVFQNMGDGKANYKPQYLDNSMFESAEVQRWNKLAGLLKD